MGSGYRAPTCDCGSCTKCLNREACRRYRARHRERVNANARARYQANPEINRQAVRRYKENNPLARTAHIAVMVAIAKGNLTRGETCEECGHDGRTSRIEAHHDDYSKPLQIKWLCALCHARTHGKEQPWG